MEATISQAVHGPDLRHSRYRGLAKTNLQNTVIAMALNIARLGDRYDTNHDTNHDSNHDTNHDTNHDEEPDTGQKKRPRRPPTRLHRLGRDHHLTDTTTAA